VAPGHATTVPVASVVVGQPGMLQSTPDNGTGALITTAG